MGYMRMIMKDVWAMQRYGFIYISDRLRNISVHGGDFMVLDYLDTHTDVTQEMIANYMMLDKATITKSLVRLEQLKYLVRTTNSDDRRKNNICLTDDGRRVHCEIKCVAKEWKEVLLAGFSKEEIEQYEIFCGKAAKKAQTKYKEIKK